jgi:hypothetical protein
MVAHRYKRIFCNRSRVRGVSTTVIVSPLRSTTSGGLRLTSLIELDAIRLRELLPEFCLLDDVIAESLCIHVRDHEPDIG